MKKLILLLLFPCIMAFFISGCANEDIVPATAKKYGYFYFLNTDWGMKPDELFDAMGKKESDFTIRAESDEINTDIVRTYSGEIKVLKIK